MLTRRERRSTIASTALAYSAVKWFSFTTETDRALLGIRRHELHADKARAKSLEIKLPARWEREAGAALTLQPPPLSLSLILTSLLVCAIVCRWFAREISSS